METETIPTKRLYQEVADRISADIAKGTYPEGSRLPAERKLAQSMSVSRATIREAMIALEISGLVEIKTGSGVFVISDKVQSDGASLYDIGPGPFELIEARTLFESEAAFVAATRISEAEIQELDRACKEMTALIEDGNTAEEADHRFHSLIAAATRNSAISSTIEQMWAFRTRMPMWRKLHALISKLEGEPGWTHDKHTIVDHRRILNAMRARDPGAARDAMRLHLEHVKEALLKASELDTIDFTNAQTFVESGEAT